MVCVVCVVVFVSVRVVDGKRQRKASHWLDSSEYFVYSLSREPEADSESIAAGSAQHTSREGSPSAHPANGRLASNSTSSPRPGPPAKPGLSSGEEPAGDDEKAFNAAVLDYNRGNYPLAAEGLSLFLRTHPQSPRCSDALFYLGLSSYNQKGYTQAQPIFERILKEYPSSGQFLPAKLKRAQCLLKQGLKPAAIKAFKEITDSFQGTPEARTAKQELDDLGF